MKLMELITMLCLPPEEKLLLYVLANVYDHDARYVHCTMSWLEVSTGLTMDRILAVRAELTKKKLIKWEWRGMNICEKYLHITFGKKLASG